MYLVVVLFEERSVGQTTEVKKFLLNKYSFEFNNENDNLKEWAKVKLVKQSSYLNAISYATTTSTDIKKRNYFPF